MSQIINYGWLHVLFKSTRHVDVKLDQIRNKTYHQYGRQSGTLKNLNSGLGSMQSQFS